MHKIRHALFIGMLVSGAPIAGAMQPSTTVYKCAQADGTVVYQDYACKGGAVVDIKPDAANPEAIARLERARIASERVAAARRANEDLAAMRRHEALRWQQDAEALHLRHAGQTNPVVTNAYSLAPEVIYAPAVVGSRRPSVRRPHSHAIRPDVRRGVESQRRVPATIRRPQRG